MSSYFSLSGHCAYFSISLTPHDSAEACFRVVRPRDNCSGFVATRYSIQLLIDKLSACTVRKPVIEIFEVMMITCSHLFRDKVGRLTSCL